MAGTLVDIVLSITLVLIYQSVWAYVIARLASAVVSLAMSYLLCSYRPKLHFVPEKARELWKFGKWLFGAKIIGYLLNEGDDWFVWFYLGGGPLKLYRYAFRFANMPATYITGTISQVSFPAYSKIQHDTPRLHEAYLKVLQLTALISVPTAFLIFTLGPDFVNLFLVPKVPESYKMILPLQIMAIQGLLRAEGASRNPLIYAMGKVHLAWYFQTIRLVIFVLIIFPLTKHWGITGTAVATVLTTLSLKPLGFMKTCQLLKCSLSSILKPNIYPLVSSVLMTFLLLCIKDFYMFPYAKVRFFLHIALGVSFYVGCVYLLDIYHELGYRRLINEQFGLVLKKIRR
jgi:O-antigen/teichoic acid export membrane protein